MRGTYYIRSTGTLRTVGHVYDAYSERDALRQFINSLHYSPDFTDAYLWNGHLLVTVENDELYATTAKEEN